MVTAPESKPNSPDVFHSGSQPGTSKRFDHRLLVFAYSYKEVRMYCCNGICIHVALA